MAEVRDLAEMGREFIQVKKELMEVAYQLTVLYDRWVVEHQQVARREAEMTRTIELFKGEVKHFSELEDNAREYIEKSVSRTIQKITAIVRDNTRELFEVEIGSIARGLRDQVNSLEQIVKKEEKGLKRERFKNLLFAASVCIIVGLLAALGPTFLYKPAHLLLEALQQESKMKQEKSRGRY